jgi:sugar phosphate isomerase/epimerase
LGLSSYIYRYAIAGQGGRTVPRLDATGLLERAAALRLQVVQFCENLPLTRLMAAEREELLRASRRLGVAIEIGTRGLEGEALLEHVDLAAMLGSRAVRVVLGVADPAVIAAALQVPLRRCHQRQVVLAIENHCDLRSTQLADLIRGMDSRWLKVCLDTANSTGQLERPMETVAALEPYVTQLHLKDFAVEKSSIGYRVVGRVLGQGWLDVPAMLAAVMGRGRDPDVLLEQWMEPEASPEETLAKEQEWVEASVRVARGYLSRRARQV